MDTGATDFDTDNPATLLLRAATPLSEDGLALWCVRELQIRCSCPTYDYVYQPYTAVQGSKGRRGILNKFGLNSLRPRGMHVHPVLVW